MHKKLLIIEDDSGLAVTLKEFFEDNGLKVFWADTGKKGIFLYTQHKPDAILLDVILPELNGFEVASMIRDRDLMTPIIMMTGTEHNDENLIKSHELGSLTFMAKPVLPQAILSLIQHILSLPKDVNRYQVGAVDIQIQSQLIIINSKQHHVREKDAQLLQFLLERKGQVMQREILLKQIWLNENPKSNWLDAAIMRLRSLFKNYPGLNIKTVYASGYIIEGSVKG